MKVKIRLNLIAAAALFLAASMLAQSPTTTREAVSAAQLAGKAALRAGPRFIQTGKITVPLRFDAYYTYEQVGEALRALHQAFPELTSIEVVSKSDEGRDIWAMTVNNPKTGAPERKPGVYVDANIHGNEIQGGEVALYLLNLLLTRYGQNDQITRLVDRNAFYVIPVVNVDGRFHFLSDPNNPSSDRTVRVPKDDDRDGLVDEDGPDDLDGDGNICGMRKRDPFGQWKADPEEPRLMVRTKPGEPGQWTILGDEGLDNDGDGKINEDGPGYIDGNRNWGYNWAPPYVQSGSGDYPFESACTRAIAKWMLAHPNIIVVFAFHNSGGMYLRGPSTKSEEPMNPNDVSVYDLLGQNAERIVPGYRYMVAWKDLYPTYGDFTNFTSNIIGSYGFVGELFVVGSETYRSPAKPGDRPPAPAEEDMLGGDSNAQARERLKFNDSVAQGEMFVPWHAYKHPQFGEIEIGGWVKMSTRLPQPFMLPDLVHRNAAAVLYAAGQTPQVILSVLGVEKVGRDLYRVRIRLANSGMIPSLPYAAVQRRSHPLDVVKVSGAGVSVVSGGVLTDADRDLVTYKEKKPEVQFLQVPRAGKIDFQFLITGQGTVQIRYESLKAGVRAQTIELK